jgi:hypothetical protein
MSSTDLCNGEIGCGRRAGWSSARLSVRDKGARSHAGVHLACHVFRPEIFRRSKKKRSFKHKELHYTQLVLECNELELAHVEAHIFENVIFETETGGQRSKSFGLDMCLTLRNLVSNVGPSFIEYEHLFSTLIQLDDFNHKKRGTNLETTSSRFRHMSRPKFF